MKRIHRKHFYIFLITAGIFAVIFLLQSYLNNLRRENISELQENVLVDLMANETQFDLLKSAPCDVLENGSQLSLQMDEIGKKLTFAEEHDRHEEIQSLKKYYSLLEMRDYLLAEEMREKCPQFSPESILYFYRSECRDCVKQGYVLSRLKEEYPWIRIYSFDWNLPLPVIRSFGNIHGVSGKTFPALVIHGKEVEGFLSYDDLRELIPDLETRSLRYRFDAYLREEFPGESIEDVSCSFVHSPLESSGIESGEEHPTCTIRFSGGREFTFREERGNFIQVVEGGEGSESEHVE